MCCKKFETTHNWIYIFSLDIIIRITDLNCCHLVPYYPRLACLCWGVVSVNSWDHSEMLEQNPARHFHLRKDKDITWPSMMFRYEALYCSNCLFRDLICAKKIIPTPAASTGSKTARWIHKFYILMSHLWGDRDNTIINEARVSSILCLHQLSINPTLLWLFASSQLLPPCYWRSRIRSLLLCTGQKLVTVHLIGWAAPEPTNRNVKWSWTRRQMGSSTVTSWTVEPNHHVGLWSANKWGHTVMCQVIHIVDHSGEKLRFNTPVGWLSGQRLQGNVWTGLLHDRSRLSCNSNVPDRHRQADIHTSVHLRWLQDDRLWSDRSECVPPRLFSDCFNVIKNSRLQIVSKSKSCIAWTSTYSFN